MDVGTGRSEAAVYPIGEDEASLSEDEAVGCRGIIEEAAGLGKEAVEAVQTEAC